MMRRATPERLIRQYAEPIERALGCIAFERLSVMQTTPFKVGPDYTVSLNRDRAVTLQAGTPLQFLAGQTIRLVERAHRQPGTLHVQIVSYRYAIFDRSDHEILAFHWTPEADPAVQRTTPHLHVGSVNISPTAPLVPRTFNKLHIPTGYVSIQAVVRFLIEELDVPPRREDWRVVLDRHGDAVEPPGLA